MNELSLGGLILSAFTSATILPGTSEVALGAVLAADPGAWRIALPAATIANTLGGMTTWALGRWAIRKAEDRRADLVRRYGAPVLLLSWAPIVGDALCLAAGWLRVSPWMAALYMAVGKGARYVLIANFIS